MSPSSGPCFVRTLHYDPSILCSPAPLSYHSFIQLHKSLYHDKAVIHEGGSIYPTGQFLNHFCRTLFLRHQMWLCGLGLKEKKMPIESTDPPPHFGSSPVKSLHPQKRRTERRRKVILGGSQGFSLPPRLASPVPSKGLLSHRMVLQTWGPGSDQGNPSRTHHPCISLHKDPEHHAPGHTGSSWFPGFPGLARCHLPAGLHLMLSQWEISPGESR